MGVFLDMDDTTPLMPPSPRPAEDRLQCVRVTYEDDAGRLWQSTCHTHGSTMPPRTSFEEAQADLCGHAAELRLSGINRSLGIAMGIRHLARSTRADGAVRNDAPSRTANAPRTVSAARGADSSLLPQERNEL